MTEIYAQAMQALEQGHGADATFLLARALKRHGLSRDDEAQLRAALRERIPVLDVASSDAMVCRYTNSPDGHFVVGPHPDAPNVVIAAGFSGHGFKFCPVIGEAVADLVIDGTTDLDLSLFDPGRFAAAARSDGSGEP